MKKNISSQKGFSIIEMVVAIAIITVIAGIVISSYFKMKPTIRINGAARQIMGDLMWAKMKSVSENNDYAVVFGSSGPDLANDRYYIYDDNDNDFKDVGAEPGELVKEGTVGTISARYEGIGYGYVPNIKRTDNSNDLLDAVTFTSSAATGNVRWFKFLSNGSSNKAGGVYLILNDDEIAGAEGRKDRMRAITVSTVGRVKIWEYNNGTNKWN